MSLDTIPIGDAVQQGDVGYHFPSSLLCLGSSRIPPALPKRHVACYSERGCGSFEHPFLSQEMLASAGSRVPLRGCGFGEHSANHEVGVTDGAAASPCNQVPAAA